MSAHLQMLRVCGGKGNLEFAVQKLCWGQPSSCNMSTLREDVKF